MKNGDMPVGDLLRAAWNLGYAQADAEHRGNTVTEERTDAEFRRMLGSHERNVVVGRDRLKAAIENAKEVLAQLESSHDD